MEMAGTTTGGGPALLERDRDELDAVIPTDVSSASSVCESG